MRITGIVITVLAICSILFLNQPDFGKLPEGERLERIKKSSNYTNGQFYNLSETPIFTSDRSEISSWIDFLLTEMI